MLSIKIGTSYIPVDESISLPLVLKSPLFPTSDSKIPGSYIFNTRFPASAQLRKEFNQAHRPAKHGRATAELDYIISNGVFRYKGKCVVTQADKDSYEIAFRVGNGDLAAKLSKLSLKDLDLGGDRILADVYSVAHDNAGFTRTASNAGSFTDIHTVEFSNTDTDFTSSFGYRASIFTAYMATTVIIKFNFFWISGNGDNPEIRLYKNSSSTPYSTMAVVDGMNYYSTAVAVVIGDMLRLKFKVDGVTGGSTFNVDYQVYRMYVEYTTGSNFETVKLGDQDTEDFAVFPIENPKLLSNFPDDAFELDNLSLKTLYTDYYKVLNYYVNGSFPLFIQGELEGEVFYAANMFTPMVYMQKLLSQIAIEQGYTLVNSPFDSTDFKNMVLFNAWSENNYTGEDTRILPIKPTFNLVDHVPDMKQSDFISYLSMLTGYFPVIDNDNLTISFVCIKDRHLESTSNPAATFAGKLLDYALVTVEPEYSGVRFELNAAGSDSYISERIKDLSAKMVYKGSVAQINDLPLTGNQVNDYYKVTSENSFYVWQYNPDIYALGWWFFSKDFPLTYTEGSEPYLSISAGLGPVLTSLLKDETLGAPGDRLWNIPVTWQSGTLEGFPESLTSEYGLQVLYYKGMANDSLGETYPLGTSWMKDYDGNTLEGTDLNAREIFNAIYKSFLQWIAYTTKPVKLQAILSASDLKALDITEIQRTDKFSFLIKELRTNIQIEGISKVEMDVYIC